MMTRIKLPGLHYLATILFCLLLVLFSCRFSEAGKTVGFLISSSGLGDQSFNDMTYAGLIAARQLHGFDLITEQAWEFNNPSRGQALQRLVNRNTDIIVVNGYEFEQLVREFSVSNPDLLFIIHDIAVGDRPNIASTLFDQYSGSFLAGALAGWMTATDKIGFIGGMDIPVIREFESGFTDGVRYANKTAKIHVSFLGDHSSTRSGFNNPPLAVKRAEEMFTDGVDILFGAAGLSGNGIIHAAQQNNRFAIGVDTDQDHMARGHVLTSVMKRLDSATLDLLTKVFRGEEINGVHHYCLKNSGVSISPMTYTAGLIPPAVHERMTNLKNELISGNVDGAAGQRCPR